MQRAGVECRESRARERDLLRDLHQRLLEQYAPPSIVIVNEEYEIVHLSERAGRYLQFVGGEPSHNLLGRAARAAARAAHRALPGGAAPDATSK